MEPNTTTKTSQEEEDRIRKEMEKKMRNTRKRPFTIERTRGIYDMSSPVRGYCLIFSNDVFETLDPLKGYVSDKKNFQTVFTELHFKCLTFSNVTSAAMLGTIRQYARMSASKEEHPTNALVVVILTHGDENNILYGPNFDAANRVYDLTTMKSILDIVSNKNCEHLRQKPKMFFVQACRGKKSDLGLVYTSRPEDNNPDIGASPAVPNLRSGKFANLQITEETISNLPSVTEDVIVCYATTPDYISSVYPDDRGSVFGAHMCVELKKWAWHRDIYEILIAATGQMFRKDVVVTNGFIKQTMVIELIGWKKKLYFNPGYKKHTKTVHILPVAITNAKTTISPSTTFPLTPDSQNSIALLPNDVIQHSVVLSDLNTTVELNEDEVLPLKKLRRSRRKHSKLKRLQRKRPIKNRVGGQNFPLDKTLVNRPGGLQPNDTKKADSRFQRKTKKQTSRPNENELPTSRQMILEKFIRPGQNLIIIKDKCIKNKIRKTSRLPKVAPKNQPLISAVFKKQEAATRERDIANGLISKYFN